MSRNKSEMGSTLLDPLSHKGNDPERRFQKQASKLAKHYKENIIEDLKHQSLKDPSDYKLVICLL